MKDVNEMTRKELESLPHRKWNESIEFDSMVILPGRAKDLHDSGFRCMDFVACRGAEPICRLSGCSDVIHIEGIGGLGKDWLEIHGTIPRHIRPVGWNIDCLKKSGLLRLFTDCCKMECGPSLSSFEVFSLPAEVA